MESGLLDSIGFVELIVFMERQTGRDIDLTDVIPANLRPWKACPERVKKSPIGRTYASNH
jgi:acyl carrier protein